MYDLLQGLIKHVLLAKVQQWRVEGALGLSVQLGVEYFMKKKKQQKQEKNAGPMEQL